MKKHLLLFAFSALALTSCDDDVQNYELDMLKGEWKTVKREVISGSDNAVLESYTPAGCEAKNITEFRIDYQTSFTAYSGVGADCSSMKTEGTYTYNNETKEMVIHYNNDMERKFKVVILSSTELRLMQMFDNIDVNGDLKIDTTYYTYKR